MKPPAAASIAALSVLLVSCTAISLTPERSAALKETQRFADEVTKVYDVRPVKIRVYEGRFSPQLTWGRYLTLSAADLDRGNARESIVIPLAAATLDYMPNSPTAVPYRRQWVFDFNRRAVEISVRFLAIPTRQAVQTHATRLVNLNDEFRRKGVRLGDEVTPCEQLHDLWSHFAMTDPIPQCETTSVGR